MLILREYHVQLSDKDKVNKKKRYFFQNAGTESGQNEQYNLTEV